MKAKLLMVVVQASNSGMVDQLIESLVRASCDVSNSSVDVNASIIIEELGYDLAVADEE